MKMIDIETHRNKIEQSCQSDKIIRLYLSHDTGSYVDTFVSSFGKEFCCLEIISDKIYFDGFNCVQFIDVYKSESPAPYHEFLASAIDKRNLKRAPKPKLDLTNIYTLLKTAGENAALITLHVKYDDEESKCEEDLSDVCYIGKIASQDEDTVIMYTIDPNAKWDPEYLSIPIENIYRVDFGGSYEEALLLVSETNN